MLRLTLSLVEQFCCPGSTSALFALLCLICPTGSWTGEADIPNWTKIILNAVPRPLSSYVERNKTTNLQQGWKPDSSTFLKKSEIFSGLLSFLLVYSDVHISVLPAALAREQGCTEQCLQTPLKARQFLDTNLILLTKYLLKLSASSLHLPTETN